MAIADNHDDQIAVRGGPSTTLEPQAVVILIAGMIAAWAAAGSMGLVGHPLQHAITWLAMAVALVAGWPRNDRSSATWAILASSTALALLMTASALPSVNVLAVAVVLAAIVQTNRGLTGRVAIIAALAVTVLALYRFSCDCIPIVWLAANMKGWVLGRLAGWLVGSPLRVGATFGGLDYLVLMAALCAGWLVATAPPRRSRAIWAVTAIVVGHFVYLGLLAYSEKLLAALPEVVLPPESDTNHVGIWTFGNGLRTLIPWNLPLLAVAIDCVIAAIMFRGASWLPVIEIDPKELLRKKAKEEKEEIPGKVLAADLLFRFGPGLLAIAAALLVGLSDSQSDLRGKKVVAYEEGYLNWLRPQYDSQVDGFYGMLPVFVESLGGKFVKSKELAKQDLADADVLILLHPDKPWSAEMLDRVWNYVRGGGSLLVVADPVINEGDSKSSFNDVLQPTSMRVRYDTAVTRTGNWEQSYEPLSHPATAGVDGRQNRFGLELCSSIRTCWPARPVLVGRWGWSDPGSDAVITGVSQYNAGEILGDLVLAAEQPMGRGTVFVLGGTSPLRNEMLANSYPFAGRLLGYLANRPSSPQTLWRQILGLAAILGMATLLAIRPAGWQIIVTSAIMSLALVCATSAGYWSGRALPDGRGQDPNRLNNIAYIDASHLEAFNSDLWTPHGIAGLTKMLMRHGYLPLLATDLTWERLERAGLLVLIAPARDFSPTETEVVKRFIEAGGTCICTVGAEEARSSASLLEDFGFYVPPSPVPPNDKGEEPEPIGCGVYARSNDGGLRGPFYAAWPVESADGNDQGLVIWTHGESLNHWNVVSSRSEGRGRFVVIGDTHIASNENIEFDEKSATHFWRWLLSNVVVGQQEWNPPADETPSPGKAED